MGQQDLVMRTDAPSALIMARSNPFGPLSYGWTQVFAKRSPSVYPRIVVGDIRAGFYVGDRGKVARGGWKKKSKRKLVAQLDSGTMHRKCTSTGDIQECL